MYYFLYKNVNMVTLTPFKANHRVLNVYIKLIYLKHIVLKKDYNYPTFIIILIATPKFQINRI